MSYKILLVDDEPANLRLLERLFRADYQVITASSGIEALELLGQFDVEVIVSDQRMPGMTGIEFLKRAAQMRQHTVRIILTGYTDVNALVEAINSGVVYKYVPKPWSNEDLQQTIVRALEHYETNKRQHELRLHNERLSARVKAGELGFARLIAEMLDLKDARAHNHARRTASFARAIGHRLELESEDIEQLELAAYLHEAGHLSIAADEFISRGRGNAALAAEDRSIIKTGSERGWQMLSVVREWGEVALAARHHAEHFDGGGFPDNLGGEQIPLFARVIAVACAYDKMTGATDFNPALTHDEAIENLRRESGRQFDPNVVETFCKLDAIGKIRSAVVGGNLTGMQLLPSRIFTDAKTLPTAELLQKFKTEPMLAFDMLKLVNAERGGGEKPTTELMPAMSRLGEPRLRLLLEQNGLPVPDAKIDCWSERAVRRAVAAQMLAAHTDIIEPDEAYALGLLFDIGELLLGYLFPEQSPEFEGFQDEERVVRQIESFGIDAVEISRLMLEACGLPGELTSSVKAYRQLMHINNPVTILLHAAHKIADRREPPKVAGDIIGIDCFAILRLTRADLFQIHERANAVGDNRIEALQEV